MASQAVQLVDGSEQISRYQIPTLPEEADSISIRAGDLPGRQAKNRLLQFIHGERLLKRGQVLRRDIKDVPVQGVCADQGGAKKLLKMPMELDMLVLLR